MPDRDKCTRQPGRNPKRPKSTLHQPFRASFLGILKPADRQVIEAFGELVEASLLESHYDRTDDTPVNVRDSRSALEDLDAILLQFRETLSSWDEAKGTASPNLRAAAFQALGLMEQASILLRGALGTDAGQSDCASA